MSYGLVFDKKAVAFLEGLPKELRRRIFGKLTAAKEEPLHFFGRLGGRRDYRLRVGDYRVIADVNHELGRIEVTLIDHRKRIYKRLAKEK